MRKILAFVVLSTLVTVCLAQTIRDEIRQDIRRSGSNYMAYLEPQRQLTEAPAGMTPFYISHYGRHGSRYHNKPETYDIPYHILASADSMGKLTVLGQDVMERLDRIRHDAEDRWGELTTLGAQQHQEIARRMMERFPEVFTDKVDIEARSTTVTRCILSMENAMMQMARTNPKLDIHHNATERDMYYLNQQDKKLFAQKMDSATWEYYMTFTRTLEKNDRLMQTLFNDTAYIRQHVNGGKLNYYLFKVASNIQSTNLRKELALYDIFTEEEIYNNWQKENAWWYICFGAATVNGGRQPYTQRNLLRKIIAEADSCIQLKVPSVNLRYGHETIVMPLVCLLDINGYGLATDDLASLAQRNWANYKIFPMACNLQLVFYRRHPQDRDVVFKVLLNEEEATLPLPSDMAPYYRWNDFKEYYLRKLDAYQE